MSIETIVIIALAAGVLFWLWRRGRRDSEEAAAPTQRSPYHCVMVVPGAGACQTARTLKNARFLSDEAPELPLVSCDSANCQCTFAHFDDRRHGDRRNPYSAESHGYSTQGGDERRRRRGRRQTDGMQVVHNL